MLRRAIFLLALICAPQSVFARADDEPAVAGKKLSYWMDLLEKGKDVKERKRGILGLELIGYANSKKVIPALDKAVREDADEAIRAAAARSLGRAMAKANEQARMEKKEELPRFDSYRETLASTMRTDKADIVREAAALGLSELGVDGRAAADSLAGALKDKYPPTVRAAAAALRRIGLDARKAQKELQQLLDDTKADRDARVDAAICLGQIPADVPRLLPTFIRVIGDEKGDVMVDGKLDVRLRKSTIEAAGKIGRDASPTTPVLAVLLLAEKTPPELRLAAVNALDQFGSEAKEGVPALVKAVGDAKLIKLMGDEARFIRPIAMHALGRMGKSLDKDRKSAIQAILKAAEDPSVEVCISAVETLGAMGEEGLGSDRDEVVKKLESLILREGRKAIRDAATASIGKIKPKK